MSEALFAWTSLEGYKYTGVIKNTSLNGNGHFNMTVSRLGTIFQTLLKRNDGKIHNQGFVDIFVYA